MKDPKWPSYPSVPTQTACCAARRSPVERIDDALQQLIDDMIETMYAAPGIGLAAPQVGVSLRVFVVDITSGQDPNGVIAAINPELSRLEGRVQADEGCLSLPGIYGPTPRAAEVLLRCTNRAGESGPNSCPGPPGTGLSARNGPPGRALLLQPHGSCRSRHRAAEIQTRAAPVAGQGQLGYCRF